MLPIDPPAVSPAHNDSSRADPGTANLPAAVPGLDPERVRTAGDTIRSLLSLLPVREPAAEGPRLADSPAVAVDAGQPVRGLVRHSQLAPAVDAGHPGHGGLGGGAVLDQGALGEGVSGYGAVGDYCRGLRAAVGPASYGWRP